MLIKLVLTTEDTSLRITKPSIIGDSEKRTAPMVILETPRNTGKRNIEKEEHKSICALYS